MMGPRQVAQGALFYEFSIEDHVPRGQAHPNRCTRRMARTLHGPSGSASVLAKTGWNSNDSALEAINPTNEWRLWRHVTRHGRFRTFDCHDVRSETSR